MQNKVVLVTGGSKGIGAAIIQRAVSDGASVVINYSRDAAPAQDLVAKIGESRALAVQADVSKVAGIEALVAAAVEKFGHIDVICANAGWMPLQPNAAVTEDMFNRIYDINVKQPLFLVQKAVPHMANGGRIILNSTSICHNSALPHVYGLYASTKGAVEQLTRALSKDPSIAEKGITVNCIAPGPTRTALFLEGKSEEMVKGIEKQSPYGRLAEPEEIANLFAFIMGPQATWVSGQTIMSNGAAMV